MHRRLSQIASAFVGCLTDTQLVITQHLDDPAALDLAAGALAYHPPELVTQCREPLQPRLHFLQVMLGNGIDLLTGHVGLV